LLGLRPRGVYDAELSQMPADSLGIDLHMLGGINFTVCPSIWMPKYLNAVGLVSHASYEGKADPLIQA
jgi:hypothetical protein